jgi:hypothetical protein
VHGEPKLFSIILIDIEVNSPGPGPASQMAGDVQADAVPAPNGSAPDSSPDGGPARTRAAGAEPGARRSRPAFACCAQTPACWRDLEQLSH